MGLHEDIVELTKTIESEIESRQPGLLGDCPLEEYVKHLDNYPHVAPLKYLSREVSDYCNTITGRSDKETLGAYHKLVLLALIPRAQDTLKISQLPRGILRLYARNFERIVTNLEADATDSSAYHYSKDRFRKDLSLCNLRLIPAGARKVHLHGIPRTYFFTNGLRQPLTALRILGRLRGFSPVYEWHTDTNDPDLMSEFNSEGWRRFHRRIAILMELNPRVRATCAGSWLYDPQLRHVSRRHSYMRELIMDNGGLEMCLGPCEEHVVQDAILCSPTRRRLHEEGKYTPMKYLLIWPRRQLLDWAAQQEDELEQL